MIIDRYTYALNRFALFLLLCLSGFCGISPVQAQESPKEEDFFKIMKVSAPEGTLLEVGGLAVLPNGDLGISTRRGDIFIVENPTSATPYFRKFASGLHEVLGLAYKEGALYAAQRGELTRLQDTDLDGKADLIETVYAWPLSGHYHEYSFGPKIAPDGSFFVTGNVAFGSEEWWRGESRVPWRGWTMKISEGGRMEPWATGMRSPAGLGILEGELFYTDNQGDWIGSGALWHVPKGAFTGHPAGLRWTEQYKTPLDLTVKELYARVDPRQLKNEEGRYIKPENVVNEAYVTLFEAKKSMPELQLPAVWLPYGILGVSTSEPLLIPEGNFGPFGGQVLVGDQGQSMLVRVFLEKVKDAYQGASFGFRSGFRSGVLRLAWAKDGSLFVGETNRGWGSAGEANEGLQRLVWNNKVPFEMRAVRAMPDGFEIEFTLPVDKQSAEDIASYGIASYIYKYTPVYGSPPVDRVEVPVKGVKVSEDGLKARIVLDNLRQYYVHEINLHGVRTREKAYSLVHPVAYYTLNNIPDGQKLQLSELSTKNSAAVAAAAAAATAKGKTAAGAKKAAPAAQSEKQSEAHRSPDGPRQADAQAGTQAPTFEEVKGLLAKNTCLACHDTEKKQVGPAYKEVAKRGYSNQRIVDLIHRPEPENWPGYATPMPPMPQVPKEEALKIAAWINSLDSK